MTDFDQKPIHKIASSVADWVLRFIVINFLVIICSLGIITIFPALSAAFQLFDDYINKVETKLFKGFFSYFKEDIKKKLLYGLFFVALIAIGVVSSWYYTNLLREHNDVILWIGYIFVLSIVLLFALTMLYSLIVLTVYKPASLFTLIKQSLFLAGKFFLRTIVIIIIWIIPILMFLTIPTIIIFMIIGLSGPLFLQAKISQKTLNFIYEVGVEENEE
ncbi:YesL family protein [Acholeplasma sp. OttesenSCG-928-E16]|nr:YesL family protein [Acholeplasma sp. OttesenSCG-928-E16]